jgi:long-chain fatty acid transport protein
MGLVLVALPLFGGGFEVESQGARAAGMAGACVAQATDPTAIWCNPGALALIPKKKAASLGMSGSTFNESLYQGLPPGVGAGTAAEQKRPKTMLPHAFIAIPLGKSAVLGTGYYHPFRMQTDWANPNAFAGRFTATSSSIEAYDFSQIVSVAFGSGFGIGAGVIYRSSSLSAARRLSVLSSGVTSEIASMTMKSDTKRALGWTGGIFIRPSASLSLGASYRTGTRKDLTGVGRLTQILTGNAQFDQLIASSLPFNQDLLIATTSEFPTQATFGAALSPSQAILLELDATRTGWKKVHDIAIAFPSNHTFDTRYALSFQDAWTYRAGLRYAFPTGPQLRFGYSLAKSPLPDVAIGAFFPDSDRTTITAGVGLDWLDLAAGMTTYKQRIVTTSSTGLNGNYRAKAWSLLMTVTK